MNKLRKNYFDDEWVIYAPGRAKINSVTDLATAKQEATVVCPFCPGAPEVGDGYDVCIIPNRYPSFMPGTNILEESELHKNGYGYQSVFMFSDRHDLKLVDQSLERIVLLLNKIGQQVQHYYQDERIEAVVAFENSGAEFGPSIHHPHGQMFALPFVPKRLRPLEMGCVICDYLGANSYKNNIIAEREHATLVCPPYARFPFEMHLFPNEHLASLQDLKQDALFDMAALLKLALRLLVAIESGQMSYMLLIYLAPKVYLHDYHLRLELVPINKPFGGRKYLGGLELGFGVFVNPAIPEEIAAQLRTLRRKIGL